MFIDATNEGDPMAAAGISYIVGCESNTKYAETLNIGCPDNRIPFKKPKGYKERDYELLFRNFEVGASIIT